MVGELFTWPELPGCDERTELLLNLNVYRNFALWVNGLTTCAPILKKLVREDEGCDNCVMTNTIIQQSYTVTTYVPTKVARHRPSACGRPAPTGASAQADARHSVPGKADFQSAHSGRPIG